MTDKELLDHILSEMNAFFPEAEFSRADGTKIVDKFWELECARWQHRIDKVFVDFEVKDLDGSGADSGDPLDFTELELYQAFNQLAAREAVVDE
jgi:hypothetical protein